MDMKDDLKKTLDDLHDTVNETLHRSTAEAERTRRETLGDAMTPSQKVASGLNEAKNRTQAEIDAAKRSVRDHT